MSNFTLEKSQETAMFIELIVNQIDLANEHIDLVYLGAFIQDLDERIENYQAIGIIDTADYFKKTSKARSDLEFAKALNSLILARRKQIEVALKNKEYDENNKSFLDIKNLLS